MKERDPFYELGRKLGESLVKGFQDGAGPLSSMVLKEKPKHRAVPSPAREKTEEQQEGSGCKVPGCGRKILAKDLCSSHYSKARRLKVLDKLDPDRMKELAKDQRKISRQKKASK